MKANELRIGNLLNWNGSESPIQAGGIYLYESGQLNIIPEPIPLTDEWLVRFGFKNRFLEVICQNNKVLEIEFDGTNDNIYQTEICVYERIIVDGETESDKVNYININHIKHVHQLQNLYFALTGDELSHE